jgi:RNA recognition motif-containing protein
MRIPKDDRAGEMPKLKGFGYVEFEDRDSLLNALVIPDTVSVVVVRMSIKN